MLKTDHNPLVAKAQHFEMRVVRRASINLSMIQWFYYFNISGWPN